jgi:hypothetical protein
MGLIGFASRCDDIDTSVIREWRRALAADGRRIWLNLSREAHTPRCQDAAAAIETLLRTVAGTWPEPLAEAVDWLRDRLADPRLNLLQAGPSVPQQTVTDELVKVDRVAVLYDKWNPRSPGSLEPKEESRLSISDDADVEPTSPRSELLVDWFMNDVRPTGPMCGVPADAVVRGRLPVAFAAPAEDLDRRPGRLTSTAAWQAVGMDPERLGPTCLLRFRQSEIGRGTVPTGIDAHGHNWYWPAPVGSPWGYTWSAPPSRPRTRGTRECVVAEFSAHKVFNRELVPDA